MEFIGIGYSGDDPKYLKKFVANCESWLLGERNPRFFGDSYLILFDSNVSRELVKKLEKAAPQNSISVFPMGKELKKYHG